MQRLHCIYFRTLIKKMVVRQNWWKRNPKRVVNNHLLKAADCHRISAKIPGILRNDVWSLWLIVENEEEPIKLLTKYH